MRIESGGREEKMWTVLNNLASRGPKDSGGQNFFSLFLSPGGYTLHRKKVEIFIRLPSLLTSFFRSFLYSASMLLCSLSSLCALVQADAKERREEKEKEAGRS